MDRSGFVSLYCDGESDAHADRRWRVATMLRPIIAGVAFAWSEQVGTYLDTDGTVHPASERQSWILAGDEHLVGKLAQEQAAIYERDRSGVNVPATRQTFDFCCKLCGYNVPCTYERLAPIFDLLEQSGVREVSLRAIAARLRGRSPG